MMTRFSKKKLAKAKGGTVSGFLSKKKAGDVAKKDLVITPSLTHSSYPLACQVPCFSHFVVGDDCL